MIRCMIFFVWGGWGGPVPLVLLCLLGHLPLFLPSFISLSLSLSLSRTNICLYVCILCFSIFFHYLGFGFSKENAQTFFQNAPPLSISRALSNRFPDSTLSDSGFSVRILIMQYYLLLALFVPLC